MTRAAWYPAATRRDGPAWKTSGDRTSTRGVVYHSVEGSLASALAVLDGPREASWHLTNPKVGRMLQHYPLGTLCWHAKGGNDWSPGVENEGRAGEPLTESQVQNLADFSAWQVEEDWLPRLTRGGSGQTLWEHNEVGRQATPPYITECPSNRIPWAEVIRRAEEEDMKLILVRKRGEDEMYVTDWGLLFRHVTGPERDALAYVLRVPVLDPVPEQLEELFDNVKAAADAVASGAGSGPTSLTGTFEATAT